MAQALRSADLRKKREWQIFMGQVRVRAEPTLIRTMEQTRVTLTEGSRCEPIMALGS
jgi:hypothetical protein